MISKNPTRVTETSTLLLLALAAALVAGAACSPHPRAASAPAPAAAGAAAIPPPPATVPADGRLNLAERLAREASTRPGAGLRVESVAHAFADAGLALGPLNQVLGRTVGARYCAVGRAPAGSAVAMCEFADEGEAARGLDYSRATFDRLVPGRRLARAHNLTLTLTPAEAGPRFADEAARATSILAAL